MIKYVNDTFSNNSTVKIIEHDLEITLPDIGYFDTIISGFSIHDLTHKRKHELYDEIYDKCFLHVFL
jgi:hypothetical protein